MWEISNLDQSVTFLFAVALGAAFSLLYDIFKSLRLALRPRTLSVALSDIFYCLICAFFTFCLLILRTKGQPRLFVFLGQLIGFIIWRLLPSRVFLKILVLIFSCLASVFRKISLTVGVFFGKICRKITELYKKFKKSSKKGLKRIKQLMYNHHDRKKKE